MFLKPLNPVTRYMAIIVCQGVHAVKLHFTAPQTWEQRSGKWCRGPATELLPLDQHFRWWWRLTVMPSLTGLAACNTDVISGWNGLIYLICGVYLVKETHSLFGKSFSLPQWLMAVIHFLHQLLAVRNTCYQNCHSCVCLFKFFLFFVVLFFFFAYLVGRSGHLRACLFLCFIIHDLMRKLCAY